jgi:hypothetical protein
MPGADGQQQKFAILENDQRLSCATLGFVRGVRAPCSAGGTRVAGGGGSGRARSDGAGAA